MENCTFCKIIKGEIPGKFVYKDDEMVAFSDINPKAPVHILLVPTKHVASLQDVHGQDRQLLGSLLLKVKEIADTAGIGTSGYKVVANNGEGSGQMVFHLHLHILGGWNKNPAWEV